MHEQDVQIKLSYIPGLKPVVLRELEERDLQTLYESEESVYLPFSEEFFLKVKTLRSVARAYLVSQNERFNPAYISNHKSILGTILEIIAKQDEFRTFKITCAGAESPEVKSIGKYVRDTFSVSESEEADLKIHIIKIGEMWEIGAQLTPRPLSMRAYKVMHMSGAMDPTIAHAVNSFCNLESAKSYMNVFSGSGTLLIEAAQQYPNIERLIGFDNNKEHLSLSIQNIKKAGLIQKVQVKEANIYDMPDFGVFDAITADLPFGMSISKDEDLEKLYTAFVAYCERALNDDGRLVAYTSEYELLESILEKSKFKIIQSLQLKLITNVDAYLRPKIFVCERKEA